jgi:hypothetical protein
VAASRHLAFLAVADESYTLDLVLPDPGSSLDLTHAHGAVSVAAPVPSVALARFEDVVEGTGSRSECQGQSQYSSADEACTNNVDLLAHQEHGLVLSLHLQEMAEALQFCQNYTAA